MQRKNMLLLGNIENGIPHLSFWNWLKQILLSLEVSSFQLDHIETFRPKISILLEYNTDHLDRYNHSMENMQLPKRVSLKINSLMICSFTMQMMMDKPSCLSARCRKIAFSIQKKLNEGAFVEKTSLSHFSETSKRNHRHQSDFHQRYAQSV